MPHAWRYGTCVIAIDLDDPSEDVTLPLGDFAIVGLSIIAQCITPGYPGRDLGGRSVIGPGFGVHIYMSGRAVPQPPRPPPMEVVSAVLRH